VLFTKYNYNVQAKENAMGKACKPHGEKNTEDFDKKAGRKATTRKT
jgi:hypothetical protein